MPLVIDEWKLNAVSPKKLSFHLQDNQPGSLWEISFFSIDGSEDLKDSLSLTSGNNDNTGGGDWTLLLSGDTSLSTIPGATGDIDVDIRTADAGGVFFTESVNFSYIIPKLVRMKLTASSGISRLRLLHTGSV